MDKEDQKPMVLSIPDLKLIPGNNEERAVSTVKRPKYRDIHYQMAGAMSGRPWGWKPFPVKLHRVVDLRGENLAYVEDERGIVRNVSDAYLNSTIAYYWDKVLPVGADGVHLGAVAAGDVDKIRKLWYAMSPAVKKPFPLLTWKSDPRPAHHKVDFDPLPVDDLATAAPMFHEITTRMTNADAVMAFFGSLFDETSQRQQYVWIFGSGKNSKGALIRCLKDALGSVYKSDEVPSGESKHWTHGLMGKRLIVFPDCNNTSFVTSGRFKSLTGEDQIRVEIKHGASLSVDLLAKYIFTSNDKPRISGMTADTRRIIYSFIKALTDDGDDPTYELRLALEVPAFLSYCWLKYKELTKGNPRGTIPTDNQEELAEVVSDTEHEHEAFVSAYLKVLTYPKDKPYADRAFIRNEAMKQKMIRSGFKTEYERRELRKYMKREHDIYQHPVKVDGKTERVWINCTDYLSPPT